MNSIYPSNTIGLLTAPKGFASMITVRRPRGSICTVTPPLSKSNDESCAGRNSASPNAVRRYTSEESSGVRTTFPATSRMRIFTSSQPRPLKAPSCVIAIVYSEEEAAGPPAGRASDNVEESSGEAVTTVERLSTTTAEWDAIAEEASPVPQPSDGFGLGRYAARGV